MGKVSLAEKHVEILQKEALGNLRSRMDEVCGLWSVTSILVTGMPVSITTVTLQRSVSDFLKSCLLAVEFSSSSENLPRSNLN